MPSMSLIALFSVGPCIFLRVRTPLGRVCCGLEDTLESLWGGASAARLWGGLCIVKESPSRRFATAVAAVKASQAFTPSGGGDYLRNRKLQSLPLSAHVMHLVSSFPQKRESSLNSGLRRVCPE